MKKTERERKKKRGKGKVKWYVEGRGGEERRLGIGRRREGDG